MSWRDLPHPETTYVARGNYVYRPGEVKPLATINGESNAKRVAAELNTLLTDAMSMRAVLVRAGSPEHRPGAGGAD